MKKYYYLFIFLFLCLPSLLLGQYSSGWVTPFAPDTIPKPMKALVLSQFPNLLIYSINRYVSKKDFAYINYRTIVDNFSFTSLWDNDLYGTNQIAHPFHGSLDFNGARVCGMNFYQSIPYTVLGSLVWEFVLENEPMSFNDQITTSFAGVILGESSFRISSALINEQARGFPRVVHEAATALFSPMQGINRLLTGRMWKHSPRLELPSRYLIPIHFGVDLGVRYFKDLQSTLPSTWDLILKFRLDYGCPFRKLNFRPLDYFTFYATINASGKSAPLSSLEVMGLWWGKQITTPLAQEEWMWGLFQHFYYKDKEGELPDTLTSMRFSESASMGLGTIYRRYLNSDQQSWFEARFYGNLVPLAAAHATRFNLKGRQYNYGSGYSAKLQLAYSRKDRLQLGTTLDLLQYFTWEGYPKGLDTSIQDIYTFRAMGDQGNTLVTRLHGWVEWNFHPHWALRHDQHLFIQDNFNRDIPASHYRFYQLYTSIRYLF